MGFCGMYSCGYGYGQVVECCKQDKEPSNDKKFGEFLDCLRKFQLLKKFCVPWNSLLRSGVSTWPCPIVTMETDVRL